MPPSHEVIPAKRSDLLRRGYLLLWVVLATIHLTQSIWVSGWRAVPGDLGDGRLNNLILEHGYQAVRGVYPFTSPGQFYPTENTLAYSDSHWGTLPPYVVARFAGASVTTAYQIWAILLAAANTAAVLWLLRVCRVPWPLAGPVGFLAVAPAVGVWFAGGHIQLLPLFALPLALGRLIRWAETRRLSHLILAAAFLCWLLLSSPYLGFFGALALSLFGVLERVFRTGPPTADSPPREGPKATLTAAAFLLLVGLPTVILYLLYFQESRAAGTRSWSELADLAPTWQNWLTAPPGHWLYGPLADRGFTHLSEQALFSGWMPWAAMIAALALFAWPRTRCPDGKRAFVFALTALGGILFFTDWTGQGDGVFLALAGKTEALRTFRASGRVILVVHLFQALALGCLLTAAWRRFRSPAAGWGVLGLALLAVGETLCPDQNATPSTLIEGRRDVVLAQWKAQGDRPLLALAPGPSNQHPAMIHLDAWAAALASGRRTVNGYNGRQPPGYGIFLADPTEAKARALIRHLGLDPQTVTMVTSWGDAGPDLGIVQYDSRPVHPLKGFVLQPVWWDLAFPIESFLIEGQPVHQFTPKATAVFDLPPGAGKLRFLFGLREGAYTGGGDSDGVGLRLTLDSGSAETELLDLVWNPRDREDQRGLQWMEVALPAAAAAGGRLTLRIDHGPARNGLWDWPVLGRLEAIE